MNEAELEALAAHLRCPDGDKGLKVAAMMNATNANIISKTIALLRIQEGDNVLEIGPGNGKHVRDFMLLADGITYFGIDISEIMVAEASADYADYSDVSFQLSDGKVIAFQDNSFDKIFTVNTIYFWEEPEAYLKEIWRVLKPGGTLCIGFIPEKVMQKIPFVKYGFNLYSEGRVRELLESCGLTIASEITEKERITGNTGQHIEREFVITSAKKK